MFHNLNKIVPLQLFFAAIALFLSPTAPASAAEASATLSPAVYEVKVPEFTPIVYARSVAAFFRAYEKSSGQPIKKGAKGKVGIKVYTNSGAGLSTPTALVDAVIDQLLRRGYERKDITIVDMSRRKLREAGFLPKRSQLQAGVADDYKGVAVADIDSRKFFDSRWYYDNPLPPQSVRGAASADIYNPELRKSYLPVPLFLSVDFWINLPMITDMEGLGVCAAIGNSSIWNMSNNERFLRSPANASMAAAEVCSIPELKDSNLFTILTLEKGQFVGGAIFNSRCTFTENVILMSANPVALDFIAWELINKYRSFYKFDKIDPMPALLNYCKELKIGDWDPRSYERVILPIRAR